MGHVYQKKATAIRSGSPLSSAICSLAGPGQRDAGDEQGFGRTLPRSYIDVNALNILAGSVSPFPSFDVRRRFEHRVCGINPFVIGVIEVDIAETFRAIFILIVIPPLQSAKKVVWWHSFA